MAQAFQQQGIYMEILAIIPARGGSKGIPGKNIKPLAGKPLIAYTIEASLKSKYITRTVVSTEDGRIKEAALAFGAEVVDRPAELAQDVTKTAPVLLQVLDEHEKTGYKPDITVLLQCTCPLRDEKQIDEAFELFFNSDCDSVFAARPMGVTHALWRKNLDGTYEGLYDYRHRPRRQDTDLHLPMYCETGATYIIRTDVLKEVKDFIGKKPEVYLNGAIGDIDAPSDFEYAEKALKK